MQASSGGHRGSQFSVSDVHKLPHGLGDPGRRARRLSQFLARTLELWVAYVGAVSV
jgi:hypothetical protein